MVAFAMLCHPTCAMDAGDMKVDTTDTNRVFTDTNDNHAVDHGDKAKPTKKPKRKHKHAKKASMQTPPAGK